MTVGSNLGLCLPCMYEDRSSFPLCTFCVSSPTALCVQQLYAPSKQAAGRQDGGAQHRDQSRCVCSATSTSSLTFDL